MLLLPLLYGFRIIPTLPYTVCAFSELNLQYFRLFFLAAVRLGCEYSRLAEVITNSYSNNLYCVKEYCRRPQQ